MSRFLLRMKAWPLARYLFQNPFMTKCRHPDLLMLWFLFSHRVKRLVESYTGGETELLIDAIGRIERRLGSENANTVKKFIRERHMEKAVEIVLEYYDKVYARSMGMHNRAEVYNIFVKDENPDEIASKILEKI